MPVSMFFYTYYEQIYWKKYNAMFTLWWSYLRGLLGLHSLNSVDPTLTVLRCYRLGYRADYDEEAVWALVQRHGGHISIRQDCIDFWIDPAWEPLLVMAFPDLERRPELDYI